MIKDNVAPSSSFFQLWQNLVFSPLTPAQTPLSTMLSSLQVDSASFIVNFMVGSNLAAMRVRRRWWSWQGEGRRK